MIRALIVGLVALQRVAELFWARRNRARLSSAGAVPAPDPAFPAMVALHAALLLGCALEPPLLARPWLPAAAAPAAVLFVLAQGLRVWAIASLGAHWNVRILTLASGSGPGFVARGPYRFARHPNYLAVLIEMIALPLFCSAWWTLAVVPLAHAPVLRRRLHDEERALAAVPGYLEAMGAKPRFLPRCSARRPKSAPSC